MPFVSQITGRTVVDCEGEKVGVIKDLIAFQVEKFPHPKVVALVIKQADHSTVAIPIAEVSVLFVPVIPLTKTLKDIIPFQAIEKEIYLVKDVLDKQIIDINGVRVIRVNDLELTRVGADYYVANIDVSGQGLLRRLGLTRLPRLRNKKSEKKPSGFITWDVVELLSSDQPMRLKVPGDKIAELHPADLAEIVSDLSHSEGSKLLQSLDDKTLADTLEEVEPDFQASLVEEMPDERVADVLEEMSPDEAADLLAKLPEGRSKELLNLMEEDEAEDVRRLLTYPEDSAGGIMNTEFIAVRPDFTAAQTIEHLRTNSEEAETVYYIYVTDESDHLIGVFSLRSLVLARPETLVSDFMETRMVTVDLLEKQEEAAQAVAKYNLLALPVVDNENRIQGIITADDALDKILPTAWKKRLPRFYH
jgi:CBS domain-containing protein